jgi:hypothetical protein
MLQAKKYLRKKLKNENQTAKKKKPAKFQTVSTHVQSGM